MLDDNNWSRKKWRVLIVNAEPFVRFSSRAFVSNKFSTLIA